jgi:hypothetical protein
MKRVLLIGAVAGFAAALLWIAAVNLIDGSLVVAGRVIHLNGAPIPDASVTVSIGDRQMTRRTDRQGCFFIGMTTTFMKHDGRIGVVVDTSRMEQAITSPGRHYLQATVGGGIEPVEPAALNKVCTSLANLSKPMRK